MSYIRTKYGIFKTREPFLDENILDHHTYVYGHESIPDREIIKTVSNVKDIPLLVEAGDLIEFTCKFGCSTVSDTTTVRKTAGGTIIVRGFCLDPEDVNAIYIKIDNNYCKVVERNQKHEWKVFSWTKN